METNQDFGSDMEHDDLMTSQSSSDLSNLKETFNQQQAKISALKELVRKSEVDQSKNSANAHEKVRNIAQRLNHLKSKARSRHSDLDRIDAQSLSRSTSMHPDDESPHSLLSTSTVSMSSLPTTPLPQRVRAETPGSEKIQLLRQQMEQNRLKMAERETNQRSIEQMVTQLKAKFDSSQLSLDQAHQLGSSVGDLTRLNEPQRHMSTGDLSGGFNLERERIKYLEKRIRYLENEAKQKESEFLKRDPNADNLKTIKRLEEKLFDFEENLKEKDEIIAAKSQAASLISESLSLKGKDTVDLLEETKQEMVQMQRNFVAAESDFEQEIARLNKEIETKNKRIENLEEVNDILETARFDLTLKNSELDSKTGNVEDYIIKLNELNRINETLQHRIETLENETDTVRPIDESIENDAIKTAKIIELEAKISETQSENENLNKSLQALQNTSGNEDDDWNDSEKTIAELREECVKLSTTLDNVQEQLQEKTVEYNVLLASFNILEEKLKSYGPKTLFSKAGDDESQAEITKLTKQLDDANKVNIKTKLKLKQLQKQIDMIKKSSDINKELLKLSDENQQLKDKIKNLEANVISLSEKQGLSSDSTDDMVDVSKEFSSVELSEKIKLLETTCQNQTSAIQLLEEQKLDMTADLNSTKTELTSLKGQIKDTDKHEVSSQIDSIVFEERIEEYRKESEQLQQKIFEIQAEKDQLRTKLEHFMAENIELLDKIEKLSKGSSAESIEILERLTHEEKLEMEHFQRQRSRPNSINEEEVGHSDEPALSLESKAGQTSEQLETIKRERDELAARIKLLENENAEYLSRLDFLQAEKSSLNSDLEKLHTESLASIEKLKELNAERDQMSANIQTLSEDKFKLEKEVERLVQQQLAARKEEEQSEAEDNTYKKSLNNLKTELENYRVAKDKNSKVSVSKKLAREAKTLADLVEKLITDYNSSVDELHNLKGEVEGERRVREENDKKKLELMTEGILDGSTDQEIQELHDQLQRYRDMETEHQHRYDELASQIEKEIANKEELKRSFDEFTLKANETKTLLDEENSRINQQLQESEAKLNDANEFTQQELQKQRKEFDNSLETNRREVEILRELVEEQKQQLITAFTEHEEELQRKTQEVVDSNEQIHRLQVALDEIKEEKSKINDSLSNDLSEKLESMKCSLDETQRYLDDQTSELSDKQTTIETLNQQIIALYATLENKSSDINEKEDEINELHETINKNNAELKKLNKNALTAERRAKDAENQLKQLNAQFEDEKKTIENKNKEQVEGLESKNKEQMDKLKKFAANLKKRNAQYAELEQKLRIAQEVGVNVETISKAESIPLQRSVAEPCEDLSKKVSTLEAKLKERNEESEHLKEEIKHFEAEIENLKVHLSKKTELYNEISIIVENKSIEFNDLQSKIDVLLNEKSETENTLKTIQDDLKSKNVKLEKCKAIIKEKNKELKRLQEFQTQTTGTDESLKLRLEQIQNEKEKIEDEYSNYRSCVEAKLQNNELVLETIEAEKNQLKDRIGRLEESICICEKRRSSLERHSVLLGLQLEQKQSQIEHAEDELTHRLSALAGQDEIIEQKLKDLESERDALKESVNELKEIQTNLTRKNSVLTTQVTEIQEVKVRDLEGENKHLREQLNRIEAELTKQKQDSDEALQAKNTELVDLENELSDHLQKIENERRSLQENLEKVRDENSVLQEEVKRLRDVRVNLEHDITSIRLQNDTMAQDQMEAQELRMQVVQDHAEVDHLRTQNIEMADRHRLEMNTVQDQFNSAIQHTNELNAECERLRTELDTLKLQLCRDQSEIINLRLTNEQHTEFETQERNEIEMLRVHNQQLENEIASIRQINVNQNSADNQMEVQQLRTQISHDQTEIESLRRQIAELDSLRMQVGQNQTDDQVFIQNENERLQMLLAEKEMEIQNYRRQNLQLQMSAGNAAAADPFNTLADRSTDLSARVADLEIQLEDERIKINELEHKIAAEQAKCHELQVLCNERETELSRYQSRSVEREPLSIVHQAQSVTAAPTTASSFFSEAPATEWPTFEHHDQQIEDLQRNVSDLEKYVTDLEHKLKSANEENLKLYSRSEQCDVRIAGLTRDLDSLNDRLHQTETAQSASQIIVTTNQPTFSVQAEQRSVADFFNAPSTADDMFNAIVNDLQTEQEYAGRTPVIEETIIPKTTYVCHPDGNRTGTISSPQPAVDDDWGASAWEADAALEEEHQRQSSSATVNQPPSVNESNLQRKIDELCTERDNLSLELSSMQTKYQKMLKKLKEYKSKADERKKSTTSSTNDLDLAIQEELNSQVSSLEQKLKEVLAEKEKENEEKKKLNSRIDVLASANDRMIEMKDKQDADMENCRARIRELTIKLSTLNEWGDEGDGSGTPDYSELAVRLSEAQSHNRMLEERIAKIQQSISEKGDHEDDRDQLIEQIDTLTSENQSLTGKINERINEILTLKVRLNELESQNDDYRSTIDLLTIESKNIQTNLEKLKDEHSQKINENSDLQQKLKEFDNRNSDLARQVENMRMYNLNEQNIEQQIQDFNASIQYKDSQIAELSERIEKETESHQHNLIQLRDEIMKLNKHIQDLQNERDKLITEKENQNQVLESPAVSSTDPSELFELKETIKQLLEEKFQMEEELKVLNDEVIKNLEIEDRIKSTVLELDMKNIEIIELKKSLEQYRDQKLTESGSNDEEIAELQGLLNQKDSLHQNAIDLLNAQWQQVVDQKCAEVADSWRQHLHTREEELAEVENNLRQQLEQAHQEQPIQTPIATPAEQRETSEEKSEDDKSELMRTMQSALEAQEIEIVSLKEQLAIRSAEYAKIAAFADPYGDRMRSFSIPTTSDGQQLAGTKGNEIDLALYMLHQRDMRCEELTGEIIHLLEERDTLQLKLSSSIRQIEELKRIGASGEVTASKESSTTTSPTKPISEESPQGEKPSAEASAAPDNLNVKLSELHNVSHSRDKTLSQDREYRQRQMNFLQRDVANMPPEALAEIFGPDYNTYARNLHNPSTNLLDWLFGSKSSNEPEN